MAILSRYARLVVSVNTGTMHLAAIVGAPVVGLNGPNANRRWGPRGLNAIGIDTGGGTCGYLDLGWEWWLDPSREPGRNCMERIGVEQVLHAIHTLRV